MLHRILHKIFCQNGSAFNFPQQLQPCTHFGLKTVNSKKQDFYPGCSFCTVNLLAVRICSSRLDSVNENGPYLE